LIFFLDPNGVINSSLGVPGAPITMGVNLPPVNPNNYPGTIHFGPSVTGADFYSGI
jgi:hypothetical protein